MRIAQVCPRYYPYAGGVETYVMMISKKLVQQGLDVEVITTDPRGNLPKREEIDGVTVRRFKAWAPREAYFFSGELRDFLNHHASYFDVVHAHSYHDFPAYYAARASKNWNRLFVFNPHYHGKGHTSFRNLLHKPYRLVGKKIFEKADRIICNSGYEKDLVSSDFRLANPAKIKVVPAGVDLAEFRGLARSSRSASEKTIALYVGRLEGYKRIDCLIRALTYLGTNFSLEIVGSGPAESELLGLARRLELDQRVTFFGNLSREDLLSRYANSSVVATLSKNESYGLCVAEALAAGTPCVVANNSALNEWVDNANCLGVDDPEDPRNVAEVIARASGKKVSGIRLSDWDDVSRALLSIYTEGYAKPGTYIAS